MKKIPFLLLIFISLTFSCKSVKRDISRQNIDSVSTAISTNINLRDLLTLETQNRSDFEFIEETYRNFDSAGIQILKPVRFTTRTVNTQSTVKTEIKEEIQSTDSTTTSFQKEDYNKKSESEGMDVVKGFWSGITKVLITVLAILVIGLYVWFKIIK